IAKMLRAYPQEVLPQIVDTTRRNSLIKWILTFASVAVLSLLFFRSRGWIRANAILFLGMAAICLIGVILFHPAIEIAFALMAVSLFISGITLCTNAFLEEF